MPAKPRSGAEAAQKGADYSNRGWWGRRLLCMVLLRRAELAPWNQAGGRPQQRHDTRRRIYRVGRVLTRHTRRPAQWPASTHPAPSRQRLHPRFPGISVPTTASRHGKGRRDRHDRPPIPVRRIEVIRAKIRAPRQPRRHRFTTAPHHLRPRKAQLDKASPSLGRGRTFESYRGRHSKMLETPAVLRHFPLAAVLRTAEQKQAKTAENGGRIFPRFSPARRWAGPRLRETHGCNARPPARVFSRQGHADGG